MSTKTPHTDITPPQDEHGSYTSYIWGGVLALLLTSTSFIVASRQTFDGWTLVFVLMGLGITQMCVQLVYFLNLDRESKPRLKTAAYLFMLLVVVILVGGTLWIMHHLDYHQVAPAELESSIKVDEGFAPEP